MKKTFAASLMLLTLVVLGTPANAASFKIYGNSLPPYGVLKGGYIEGFSADLIRAVFSEMGKDLPSNKIVSVPFARIYKALKEEANVIGLHVARNPIREKQFHWVGPYYEISMGLIGKKSLSLKGQTPQELRSVKIAVVRDTLPEQLLDRQGVENLFLRRLNDPESAIQLLEFNRVDLFAHVFDSTAYLMRQREIDPNQYEEKISLKKAKFYFGVGKRTAKKQVVQLQKALDKVMKSPEYQNLCSTYYLQCSSPQ